MQNIRSYFTNGITFLTALIPVFKSCPPCPICMPKYAAIFAFFGLQLADYSQYLIPVMLLSMGLSLSTMLSQSLQRKLSTVPFYLTLSASVTLLISKFYIDNLPLSTISMAGIVLGIVLHYTSLKKSSCCC